MTSPPPAGTAVRHTCGHTHVHPGVDARIGSRSKQLGKLAEQPCPSCRLAAAGGPGGTTDGGTGGRPVGRG